MHGPEQRFPDLGMEHGAHQQVLPDLHLGMAINPARDAAGTMDRVLVCGL